MQWTTAPSALGPALLSIVAGVFIPLGRGVAPGVAVAEGPVGIKLMTVGGRGGSLDFPVFFDLAAADLDGRVMKVPTR